MTSRPLRADSHGNRAPSYTRGTGRGARVPAVAAPGTRASPAPPAGALRRGTAARTRRRPRTHGRDRRGPVRPRAADRRLARVGRRAVQVEEREADRLLQRVVALDDDVAIGPPGRPPRPMLDEQVLEAPFGDRVERARPHAAGSGTTSGSASYATIRSSRVVPSSAVEHCAGSRRPRSRPCEPTDAHPRVALGLAPRRPFPHRRAASAALGSSTSSVYAARSTPLPGEPSGTKRTLRRLTSPANSSRSTPVRRSSVRCTLSGRRDHRRRDSASSGLPAAPSPDRPRRRHPTRACAERPPGARQTARRSSRASRPRSSGAPRRHARARARDHPPRPTSRLLVQRGRFHRESTLVLIVQQRHERSRSALRAR